MQEVAETFEEMLQAVEKGQTELPPRFKSAPGQFWNEAKQRMKEEEEMYKQMQGNKNMLRKNRDEKIKEEIKLNKEAKQKEFEETKDERAQRAKNEKLAIKKADEARKKDIKDRKDALQAERDQKNEELMSKKQEEN